MHWRSGGLDGRRPEGFLVKAAAWIHERRGIWERACACACACAKAGTWRWMLHPWLFRAQQRSCASAGQAGSADTAVSRFKTARLARDCFVVGSRRHGGMWRVVVVWCLRSTVSVGRVSLASSQTWRKWRERCGSDPSPLASDRTLAGPHVCTRLLRLLHHLASCSVETITVDADM